jgi:CRP-like cAMP-binding protein
MEAGAFGMHFKREEEIYGEGEPAEYVYKVISGAVRLCSFDPEGRRLVEGFYLPGDLIGFEDEKVHRFSAEALCDCELAVYPRAAMERAAFTDKNAAFALYMLTSKKLRQTNDHLMVLGKKRAVERVAAFLLQMVARSGGDVLHLPMSRVDIADYLGLTIETVSRIFSMFERSRAISLSGARNVTVNNVGNLQSLAA